MKQGIAICIGLIALGAAGASSAQAQIYSMPPPGYVPMYEPGIPPSEILMIVRSAGLRPLTQAARRGSRYVLLASDHTGGQLRVVVSAYDGRILRVSPAYDPRFAYQPARPPGYVPVRPQHYGPPPIPAPRHSAPGPEVKDPPPVVYGSRNPPATAEPTPPRPARTPLPRPRPNIATNQAAPATPQVTEAAPATPPVARPQQVPPQTAPAPQSKSPQTELVPVAPLE